MMLEISPATKPYGGNGRNNRKNVYCTRCKERRSKDKESRLA